jgi:negative modulator of initiation of replication
MPTVDLDDELYNFLLRNSTKFGESPSDVIRRLLKVTDSNKVQSGGTTGSSTRPSTQTVANRTDPVTAFVSSPNFLVHGNVLARFLSVLAWLHKQHPEKFDKVLLLNGRKRRYFAKTEKELEDSGNSVMPKRIPDSPYWVFTNSPTELKKQVIHDVMRVLGYESSVIRSVCDALSGRLTG